MAIDQIALVASLRTNDRRFLDQFPVRLIKDQNAVVVGHDTVPIRALHITDSVHPGRQFDAIRQGRRFAVQPGDKQRNDQYNAANHHGREHGHQNSQKPKIGRQFRLGSFVHDIHARYLSDRGKPACAP